MKVTKFIDMLLESFSVHAQKHVTLMPWAVHALLSAIGVEGSRLLVLNALVYTAAMVATVVINRCEQSLSQSYIGVLAVAC